MHFDPAPPGTVLVGLVGRGIGRSRTPRMHMEEAAAQGLRLDYRLIDVDAMESQGELWSERTY